jgi:exodeoxyribonuclease V alpha subunit
MTRPAPELATISAWRHFERRSGLGDERVDKWLAFASFAEALNLSRDAIQIAAEIAGFEPALAESDRDALIALVLILLATLDEGSTRLPVSGADGDAALARLLQPLADTSFGGAAPLRFVSTIRALLAGDAARYVIGGNDEDYKPLLYLGDSVYLRKTRVTERRLAGRLAQMIGGEPSLAVDDAELQRVAAEVITAPIKTPSGRVELSDEQRSAVEASARSRLMIISGGPGTGKTSITIAIVRLMARLGIDPRAIGIAAPTGKAANRIRECLELALSGTGDEIDRALAEAHLEPVTLHRLLGYSERSRRFRYHLQNPLAYDVVLVDEGSMLDLTLMERLAGAMRDGSRLVILGDANQLPSVAAGAVFRELMSLGTARDSQVHLPCIRLERSFRTSASVAAGRAIVAAARRVNDGDADLFESHERVDGIARRKTTAELNFNGVEMLAWSREAMSAFLDRWQAERIVGDGGIQELRQRIYREEKSAFAADDLDSLRRLFAFSGASRILTVTRVLDSGAERVNQLMHRRTVGVSRATATRLVAGEPIIAIRNDYERALFNGDLGLALRVRRGNDAPALMGVFPRGENFAAYRLDTIRDLIELAYAMTVHKAQGSEFAAVALILPEKKIPLLTREVVYTALSRARRSATIVGTEDVLIDAVGEKVERYSALGQLLAT